MNSRRTGGFTLVELIVAAGLFSFAISIVVGVFGQALRSQKLLNSLIQLNSNAGLMIEQMMREIRVGYRFTPSNSPGSSCSGTYDTLSFDRLIGSGDARVFYKLDGSSIKRSVGEVGVNESVLNSSTIAVKSLCFRMKQRNTEELPWMVTIYLKIRSTDARLANREMDIQTTVSARTLPSDLY